MKKVTLPQQAVVFGSDRIASIWALRNGVDRKNVVLATHPMQVEVLEGPIKVVRVTEEEWKPSSFPDETRVKETEKLLKKLRKEGHEVQETTLE